MTVPSLDICGNDLSANTTYEITTGPVGNINNISFVKKQPDYIFSAAKDADQSLSHNTSHTLNGWVVQTQKNTNYTVGTAFNGLWQCPADGMYHIFIDGLFHNADNKLYQVILEIFVNNVSVRFSHYSFNAGNGTTDDFGNHSLPMSTVRSLSQGDNIRFDAFVKTYNFSTSTLQGLNNNQARSEISIIRVG